MTNEFIKRLISSIILIPLVFFFIIKGSLLFNLFIFVCFLIIFTSGTTWQKVNPITYLAFLFIIFSFTQFIKLEIFILANIIIFY